MSVPRSAIRCAVAVVLVVAVGTLPAYAQSVPAVGPSHCVAYCGSAASGGGGGVGGGGVGMMGPAMMGLGILLNVLPHLLEKNANATPAAPPPDPSSPGAGRLDPDEWKDYWKQERERKQREEAERQQREVRIAKEAEVGTFMQYADNSSAAGDVESEIVFIKRALAVEPGNPDLETWLKFRLKWAEEEQAKRAAAFDKKYEHYMEHRRLFQEDFVRPVWGNDSPALKAVEPGGTDVVGARPEVINARSVDAQVPQRLRPEDLQTGPQGQGRMPTGRIQRPGLLDQVQRLQSTDPSTVFPKP